MLWKGSAPQQNLLMGCCSLFDLHRVHCLLRSSSRGLAQGSDCSFFTSTLAACFSGLAPTAHMLSPRLGSAPLHTLATVMVLPQSWVLSSPGIFTATEASLTAMASRLTCRDSTPAVWCRAPGQFSFSPVGLTVNHGRSAVNVL